MVNPNAFQRRKSSVSSLTGKLALIFMPIAGCAAPAHNGEIPIGRWSGEGRFVYESQQRPSMQPGDSSAPPAESLHRPYSTTLAIRRDTLDGHEVCVIDIVSSRGELPNLGGETRLTIALEQTKRVSADTALYRGAGILFNPGPEETLTYQPTDLPNVATCTDTGGATVLQIQYEPGTSDTFRFQGDTVEKAGALCKDGDETTTLIQWVERLHRGG